MAKPRLLAVATVPPSPVTNGYALRVYHLLVELAAEWEITLVAPPDTGPASVKGLCDYVPVTPSGVRTPLRRMPSWMGRGGPSLGTVTSTQSSSFEPK